MDLVRGSLTARRSAHNREDLGANPSPASNHQVGDEVVMAWGKAFLEGLRMHDRTPLLADLEDAADA